MASLDSRCNPPKGPGLRPGRVFSLLALCSLWLAAAAPGWAQRDLAPAQASRAYRPVYPFDALLQKEAGWADVSFTIDHSGRAMLVAVEGASSPDFGRSWKAEIEAVEFIPPRPNGKPILSRARERFNFPAQPSVDTIAAAILEELRKPAPVLVLAAELDQPLKPIRQPRPAYPAALRGEGESGKAVIEFVVDRNGRSLFPRIVSATHPDFGWAAATSVVQWRFEPPLKNGGRVDVRQTATVEFDIANSADMW